MGEKFGVLAVAILLCCSIAVLNAIPNADAAKSSGTHLAETSSKKVCGDRLCDERMSVEEKVEEYLDEITRGPVNQQSRFSDIGVSQQAFDLFDTEAEPLEFRDGKVIDNILGYSIGESSLWDLEVTGNLEDDRVALFTSKQDTWKDFPPFFSIMLIKNVGDDLKSLQNSDVENEILQGFLDSFNSISDIEQISDVTSSVSEMNGKLQTEISGQMVMNVNGKQIPVKFEIKIHFTDSGDALILTHNSSPDDYSQSVKEFRNSVQNFVVGEKHDAMPAPVQPTPHEICNDLIDNDGDQFIDGSDPDCLTGGGPSPVPPTPAEPAPVPPTPVEPAPVEVTPLPSVAEILEVDFDHEKMLAMLLDYIEKSKAEQEPPALEKTQPISPEIVVTIAMGSDDRGCELIKECYNPFEVKVKVGDTVTWENPDAAPHTITSGVPTEGPDGIFDSELMLEGGTFSQTFAEPGTNPYFCKIHPWMEGVVVVG